MKLSHVLTLGFGLLVSAKPYSDIHTFEEIHEVPHGWQAVGEPAANTELRFKLALRSAEPDLLTRTLREVSSPGSPSYGKHLKREEVAAVTAPSIKSRDTVVQWLKRSGVSDVRPEGSWVHFTARAEQANRLMNTKFLEYRHASSEDASAVRTTKVALPRSISEHVQMIHPTTRFAQMEKQLSSIYSVQSLPSSRLANQADPCNTQITPDCLRKLYKIGGVEITDPSKTGFLGVAGFLKQYARYNDLTTFGQRIDPATKGANFTWTGINGGVLPQDSSDDASEANLDIQYTVAISKPLRNNFYSTPGNGPLVPDLDQPTQAGNQNEPYLEFFQYLLAAEEVPHTVTISYGESEQSVPPSYAQTVCDLIAKLGARGVSILASSGDTGPGSGCQSNDGKNTTRFTPNFPASCPYTTSIGGTYGINPERAVDFSSGGFSDLWPRPWYQDKLVPAYLEKLGTQWKGLYNPEGRGFPDISAQGSNFQVVVGGRAALISGTSASSPVVAGIIGLLNAERLQNGEPALGFLNPWLYEEAETIATDIVNGGSAGCTGRSIYSGLTSSFVANASWAAVEGWDPVTGIGTPKFDQMLQNLPAVNGTDEGQSSE